MSLTATVESHEAADHTEIVVRGRIRAGDPGQVQLRQTAIGLNGFMSSARKYKQNYPIEEVLAFAARHGFEGVELVRGWPAPLL